MASTYLHTDSPVNFAAKVHKVLLRAFLAILASSLFYLWFITHNRYHSEATFKISRQESSSGTDSTLASIIMPGLNDSATMDAFIAIGFIQSADLLIELEEMFNLQDHYSSPKVDLIFRLRANAPLEERLKYYRKRIKAHFENETNLTYLTVDAFNPELAQNMANTVLEKAEAFVNQINQDVAEQQISFIMREVERSTDQINDINRELLKLQNKHQFIRPTEVISASLAAVQELEMERLKNEAELATLLRDSPESPRIGNIQSMIQSLAEVIENEKAKLSGDERDRLNQILMDYQAIELRLEVATNIRTGVEILLEKNRAEATARSRFFTVIQNPYLPEDVAIPRRGYWSITIFCIVGLSFMITRALVNSVFERK